MALRADNNNDELPIFHTTPFFWAHFQNGLIAGAYHAHLPRIEQKKIMSDWFAGRIKVLFATSALAMGVDIQHARFVVHLHVPLSITDYLQETGRCGRDGNPAHCYLFYAFIDAFDIVAMELEQPDPLPAEAIRTIVQHQLPKNIGSFGKLRKCWSPI